MRRTKHLSFHVCSVILRVEPIIYKNLVLDSPEVADAFLRSLEISTKPSSFYELCIKALYWDVTVLQSQIVGKEWGDIVKTAIKLLPYCKGVEYLFCWISPEYVDTQLVDVVVAMRPKRLDADLTNLIGTRLVNFSLPFFHNVTHLVLGTHDCGSSPGVHHLPRLSHFLVDWDGDTSDDSAMTIATDVLSHCTTLQVCVIRSVHPRRQPWLDKTLHAIVDDRLVFIIGDADWRSDWHSFANCEPDTWDYAEAAVAMQRRQQHRIEPFGAYDETNPFR